MKILVTGGAGFIGVNFIYYLLKKYPNDQVFCLDLLTYAGNLRSLEEAMKNDKFKFVLGDITDREYIYELFSQEEFDLVVNFAAESHVDRSIENPEVFLKTNILGTQVLMDACLKYGNVRFHQVSTDEVYGDLPLDRKDLFFKEDTNLCPSSPYSASKASADLLVLSYIRTFNLRATISRCSNNYGPYQFPEKLIPVMIYKALNNEPLPVYGNGLNVRDWLYVEDHCIAIDEIIRHGKINEIYNIGGNNEKENIEIVRTILNELGKSEELITYVKDRLGHDLRYAIDSTKIKKELNWIPKTSFESGIKKTIKWNLDNKKWLDEILSNEYLNYNKKR
ncbi:dTDP-glucose 4,6-dehydratase [Acholeplasma sp. OttesenSCG-928-E16]|nr:dTDP-glucose 4,6-dehydratase [Acholeplasma sp. OttesenSCG-928-E16]